MRFRKLRIAWSVAWGVAAVLSVVLWVRSYWSAMQFMKIDLPNIATVVLFNTGTATFGKFPLPADITLGNAFPWQLSQCRPVIKPHLIWQWRATSFAIQLPTLLISLE